MTPAKVRRRKPRVPVLERGPRPGVVERLEYLFTVFLEEADAPEQMQLAYMLSLWDAYRDTDGYTIPVVAEKLVAVKDILKDPETVLAEFDAPLKATYRKAQAIRESLGMEPLKDPWETDDD